jgi:hypothetical protein
MRRLVTAFGLATRAMEALDWRGRNAARPSGFHPQRIDGCYLSSIRWMFTRGKSFYQLPGTAGMLATPVQYRPASGFQRHLH